MSGCPTCRCTHAQVLHMGLVGPCLASLNNGTDYGPVRRLSDLCCEVDGGCGAYRPADADNTNQGDRSQ